jgi:MoxR-like ATPase
MNESTILQNIVNEIEKVIIGKRSEIYGILKGIIAGGHILIEDVPGVGKTTLAKALSNTLNLKYRRIQCTPDLLPSDITGISIYNQKTGTFEFKKGPIFSNIVLADEINRTSPKTQSALLEVMEEVQVSEGNDTYVLEKPFIVLATQNPVEFEGTFILPEAQLDRFMIKVKLGYTDIESESKILQNLISPSENMDKIQPCINASELIALQKVVKNIHVSKAITDYIVNIVNKTRDNKYILLGGSTRASISLLRIAQANALIKSRDFVIPEDVKENAISVLSHRIILSPIARANNLNSEAIIKEIVDGVNIPRS